MSFCYDFQKWTIVSFASVVEICKCGPFRKLLDKQDTKKFDEMLTIPHLYTVAGTMAARPVLSHVILISIIFEHYKQLRKIGTSTARPQILE